MKINDLKNKIDRNDPGNNKTIKEILVIDQEVIKCEGITLCYPEPYFEMIETCKLCGKCI